MRYFLCPGRTDMRKGISSLCGVVHERMGCSVRNGDVFINLRLLPMKMKITSYTTKGNFRLACS
ncbi:IS66 family insertion sequence element accessory protein TnpB [Bacteroides xylanisolvens]